jgi:outer membrane protein
MKPSCGRHPRGRFRSTAGVILLLASITLAGGARAAETWTVSASPMAKLPAAPELRIEDGKIHLSLDEAIEIALRRNLGLEVERYTRQETRLGIQQAMGIYDFNLGATFRLSHDETPAASQLTGAAVEKLDIQNGSLGVSRLFPTGGTAKLGWNDQKLKTNSSYATINPSYNTGLNLELVQPLLQNFGRAATDFGIRVARLSDEQSREIFRQQVIGTIQSVEDAYWGVVEANEQLKVAEESKRIAVQLHQDNKIRVNVGTLAPLELVSSEAGIATREEDVIMARAAIGNAEDVLKTLLRVEQDEAWAAAIVPETTPEAAFIAPELDQALASALQSRPELAAEQLAQKSRVLSAEFYRQATKPSLDLTVDYGYNGVGSALGRANDQITATDFPTWAASVNFGYPILNRTARARSAIARLTAEQGEVGLTQLEQQIRTEVRLAVRGLETARQELESSKVSVRLQTANLDAERKKFLNGLSTSFQILQVEEQLTSAKSREVQAVTGYRRAMVEYYRAIGNLLVQTGVEISD